MITSSIKLDSVFEGQMDRVRKNVADAMIAVVLEEFNTMLRNAPQRYGNFVANFSISPGLRTGRVEPKQYFSTDSDDPATWFSKGRLEAVKIAMGKTKSTLSGMTAHITRTSGWMSGMTVYNRIGHAEKAEGYSEATLRKANKGASHPLAKMEARLEARSRKKIEYGSPEFERLIGRSI